VKKTTISISRQTQQELKSLGHKDDDYDSIIKRAIKFSKKFSNERQFHDWFKNNFLLFGFDRIITEEKNGFSDFVMEKNKKEVRVKLETLSSNFMLHKHNPKAIDLVICLIKDMPIPVKTLEITPFEYENSRKGFVSLQIDKEALACLKKMGIRDESYSQTIKRISKNPYNFDEGIIKQLNSVSEKWGIDHKTALTFGAVFIIFLASSGAIQQLQSIALKANKPMLVVFMELLKRFRI